MRGGVVIMGCYCFTTTGVTPSLPLSTILHVNLASQRHLVNLMRRSLRHTLFRSIPPYYGDLGLSVLLPPHEQTAGRFFFTKFTLI